MLSTLLLLMKIDCNSNFDTTSSSEYNASFIISLLVMPEVLSFTINDIMRRFPSRFSLALAKAASLIIGKEFVSWSMRAPWSTGSPCVAKMTRLSLRVVKLSGIVITRGPIGSLNVKISFILSNNCSSSSKLELSSVLLSRSSGSLGVCGRLLSSRFSSDRCDCVSLCWPLALNEDPSDESWDGSRSRICFHFLGAVRGAERFGVCFVRDRAIRRLRSLYLLCMLQYIRI